MFEGGGGGGGIPRVLYGYPSVHGAVFLNRNSYGPVRCGFKKAEILRCGSVRFSKIVNATVRFGVFLYPTLRSSAVSRNRNTSVRFGAVRCGSLLNGCCYGAGPIPVGKTVKPCFPYYGARYE